jgi:hypothetical protein
VSKAEHQFEAKSLGQFLRKIAIDYLRYGYTRYALREIPGGKDLAKVDAKLMFTYQVAISRSQRSRRRVNGLANVVYLRFGNRFILMASEGFHPQFDKLCFLDFRSKPLVFDGYSIGFRDGKVCVSICAKRLRSTRKNLLLIALHNQTKVETYFRNISPFSFPGIIRQKRKLLAEINRKRKKAGLTKIQVDLRFNKKVNRTSNKL